MKAVRFYAFGGPGVLRYEDVTQPIPGPGQVRVQVRSTSFNDVDSTIRDGSPAMPVELPHVPCVDVAGIIDALGPGVDTLVVSDRVVGLLPMTTPGAAAEHVLAPASGLAGAPRRVPLDDLGALPLVGLTAWQSLFDHGHLTAGQQVLIVGADSEVGGYAVQLAHHTRAHVIATTGGCRSAPLGGSGPDEVLHAAPHEVASLLSEPVDLVLVLDPVGVGEMASLLPAVRSGGALVNTVWGLAAPSEPTRGVRGINLVVRSDADQLADLIARVSTGELTVDITARVALADLPAVHAEADAGRLPGKVLVLAHPL